MNTCFCRTLATLAMSGAVLFTPAPAQTEAVEVSGDETRSIPLLTPDQLDELLGPIALYPDALIALMLPAATMPADVVLAARYLSAGGDTAKLESQPWDETVRALARHPDVVKMMDEKLSWVITIGDAFIAQPVDVMQSIQRLRARARAAGTLVDSPEQKVLVEDSKIRVVPANPEVIYVPVYDPQVVYVSPPSWSWYAPPVRYRWYYPTGAWLSYDCDWNNWGVWVVGSSWRFTWYSNPYWCGPVYPTWPKYHCDNYGYGWRPHYRHHHYNHHGHDRPTHVVVRNGYPDTRGRPPGVDSRSNGGGSRDNPGNRRTDGGNYRRDDSRGAPSGGDRPPPSGQPGRRSDPPTVVTQPPRSTAPETTTPRRTVTADGTSRRWTGRAGIANPDNPPAGGTRVPSPALTAPRTSTPSTIQAPDTSRRTPSNDGGTSRRWVGRAGITQPAGPPATSTVRTPAPVVQSQRSAPSFSSRTQVVRTPMPVSNVNPGAPSAAPAPAPARSNPGSVAPAPAPAQRKGDVNRSIRRGESPGRSGGRGGD